MHKRLSAIAIAFLGIALLLSACRSLPRPPVKASALRAATASPVAPTRPALTFPTATPDPRPIIETPSWVNDAVFYQIFPRSFYDSNGDAMGDLQGVAHQLDYVQSLGATAIWLTPHYPSTTYHGYDVVDYQAVNPQFGTLEDFKAVIAEAHKRNLKIVIDFVANHSSNAHPYFKDAYGNPKSKYTSWYHFSDSGNTQYKSFFGVAELPEWNHENPDVNQYLIDSALFWLDLKVDGLRCDYALGVEREFWAQLRKSVKAKHPDALILGEVWDGNPIKLKQYYEYGFDALFDFPWYLAFAGNPDANGDGLLNGALDPRLIYSNYLVQSMIYPRGAQVVRFGSNHDTNRIASDVEGDPARMRLAAAAVLLAPGTPIIYYGEELGMRGTKGRGPYYDEYRREPMDWYAAENGPGMTQWFKPINRNNKPDDGISVEEEDRQPGSLLSFYRTLTQLRAQHPALRSTEFKLMEPVAGCSRCVAFWRWAPNEVILVVQNFGPNQHTVTLDPSSAPTQLPQTSRNLLGGNTALKDLTIGPWGVIVLQWQ